MDSDVAQVELAQTPEAASPDPLQKKEFEKWLDNTYGLIEILDGVYLPSEVLYKLDPVQYETSLQAYIEEGEAALLTAPVASTNQPVTNAPSPLVVASPPATLASTPADPHDVLRSAVKDRFPTPVAFNFRRFESGTQETSQRLAFLKDVWESVIFLLYALLLGEFRCSGGSFTTTKFNLETFLSDKIDNRLNIMKKILDISSNGGPSLLCASFVTPDVLDTLRELTTNRNEFSHSGALSPKQVQDRVDRYKPIVYSLLQDVIDLQDVRLLLYTGSNNILTLNHQAFIGHSTDRVYDTITIQRSGLSGFEPYMTSNNKILAYTQGRLFSVAPFVHYADDESGHRTRLSFYKRMGKKQEGKKGKLVFEIVGEAMSEDIDEAFFQDEIDDLCSRLAPTIPTQTAIAGQNVAQATQTSEAGQS